MNRMLMSKRSIQQWGISVLHASVSTPMDNNVLGERLTLKQLIRLILPTFVKEFGRWCSLPIKNFFISLKQKKSR